MTQQRTTDNEQRTTTPPCPHFGPCGGCQLQNLTYSAQIALKATNLRALLSAACLTLPELQLHASPPLAYRNRVRFTLAEVDGQLRAGYLTANSVISTFNLHESVISTEVGASAAAAERPPHSVRAIAEHPTFLPITQCPIAAPILWRATETLLTLINNDAAYWLRSPQFKLDQLELFTAADESKLQVTLYLRTAAKSLPAKLTTAFTALCEALRASVPELIGAGIAILPPLSAQRSRRTEIPKPGPNWGAAGLLYDEVTTDKSVTPYWVTRGAFFQVNRFMIETLAQIVTSNRRGILAWDLYAGVGLFARALADQFDRVVAVEVAEPAATDLAQSLKGARHTAIKATTLDFLRAAVLQRDRPDLIVLDPPRTGAGRDICELLDRVAAPTLIYVSCSPETLPADLVTLAASGYRVTELHLLDLFPQTTHIETVAILTR